MQPKQLLQRYKDGKRDFSWIDLQDADLSGAALPGINLYRANLSGANLQGVDFSHANLFKATLTQANLNNATFSEANLSKADLTGATIDLSCLLKAAKARGAILPDGNCYVEPISEAVREEKTEEREPPASSVTDSSVTDSSVSNALDNNWTDKNNSFGQPNQTRKFQPAISVEHASAVGEGQLSVAALGGLTCGYLCYGLVLGGHQAPVLALPVVWSTAFISRAKFESVWTVPITAAAAVILCSGVSLGVFIFAALPAIMFTVGFNVYGSILNQQSRKTMKDIVFFSALCFVLMGLAPWMADGGGAYSGGGIVANLDSFILGLFLIFGMICTSLGSLFLLRDVKERLVEATEYGDIGGESMIGRFEDVPYKTLCSAPDKRCSAPDKLCSAPDKENVHKTPERMVPKALLQQRFGVTAAVGLIAGRLLALL